MAQEILTLDDWVKTHSIIGYSGWDGVKDEFSSGWLSQELINIMEKTYDQYEPQKEKIIQLIKTGFSEKNNKLTFKDISVTNQNKIFLINFGETKIEVFIDFEKVIKDVKQWSNLNLYCLDFLRSEAISTLFEIQDQEAEKLKEKNKKLQKNLEKLKEKKKNQKTGITKNATSLVKASTISVLDFKEENSLFNIPEVTTKEEIIEAFENKTLAHLNNQAGYFFDAFLSYIKEYRLSKEREGTQTIFPIKISNIKENISEENLRILDTWDNFCRRAGADTHQRRQDLKHMLNKGDFSSIGLGDRDGDSYISYIKNFISIEFILKESDNKNLKRVSENTTLDKIQIDIKTNHLKSIIEPKLQGQQTTGFMFWPEKLQHLLVSVFDNEYTQKALQEYCMKNNFKRSKGKKWSDGIRSVFTNLALLSYWNKSQVRHPKNNEQCNIIILKKDRIKEFAKTACPVTIKSDGKFRISEAIEYIAMSLKVIKLANENYNLDYIVIIDFQIINKEIHIYIKEMDKKLLGEREKIKLL